MAMDRDQRFREMVLRGKYRRLYTHLCALGAQEWRASFNEIESVLGFALPPSARLYRPWWANQKSDNGHSQSLAWGIAGWETADVDMDAETLVLKRKQLEAAPRVTLADTWPVHQAGAWPDGLSLRREVMYEDGI